MTTQNESRPVVLTCAQPTGRLHLGNYLGAVRTWVELQQKYRAAEWVWCQEEPKNMGAWTFLEPNIEWVLQHTPIANTRPRYVGRPASAATANLLAASRLIEWARAGLLPLCTSVLTGSLSLPSSPMGSEATLPPL